MPKQIKNPEMQFKAKVIAKKELKGSYKGWNKVYILQAPSGDLYFWSTQQEIDEKNEICLSGRVENEVITITGSYLYTMTNCKIVKE